MFELNQDLLDKARAILWEREDIYWIIGGSCSGKSTICQALSMESGLPVYDMDEHVFGRYMPRFRDDRHPASRAWFTSQNPLAWSLSLQWQEFEAMYRAANAEYLDLLAEDLSSDAFHRPQIIDGGITHPSVLVQAVRPERVICLDTDETSRALTWETSEEKLVMKEWISALPDPDERWASFLNFDKLLTQTIVAESREENIKCIFRGNATTVDELSGWIRTYFGF